ncbi:MAG: hypothetical protein WDM81_01740 [Rhizomicrobium sp.]
MSVVALARSYTSVQGAPVIHSVDTAIFSLRYFAKCMDCTFCDDQCCSYGVDIDVGNAMRIAALGEDFSARIAAPRANGSPTRSWTTQNSRPGAICAPASAAANACSAIRPAAAA